LANKPSPKKARADWAAHFRARRLGAAAKKPVSNVGQLRDLFKAVKLGVSPCSRVGHRLKAMTPRQIVGTAVHFFDENRIVRAFCKRLQHGGYGARELGPVSATGLFWMAPIFRFRARKRIGGASCR